MASLTRTSSPRVQVFDRRQIAAILGIPLVVVRNWSTGNPFTIEPSILAAGRRGSPNLYALEEVYLFGIAGYLSISGIQAWQVKKVLSYLQDHSDLLKKTERDVYLTALAPMFPLGDVPHGSFSIAHCRTREMAKWVQDKLARMVNTFGILVHLGRLLDWIDGRIASWERKQKDRGKKASRSESGRRK